MIYVNRELIEHMGELSNGPIPEPITSTLTTKPGIEKSPFQISANQLEDDENVNRTHLGYIGWLWSDAMNNRTAFTKAPNDRAQYGRSSSGLIAIVVMVLFSISSRFGDFFKQELLISGESLGSQMTLPIRNPALEFPLALH